MNQELLDLAKRIDDNEDAISDALENEEFDRAIEDKSELHDYLNSLLEVTQEQRDILDSEHNRMRSELRNINRGFKGNKAYRQVRSYINVR